MWNEPTDNLASRPDWFAVILFWFLAFAWSFAAARLVDADAVSGLPIDTSLLSGFGPAFAVVVVSILRRSSESRVTLLGAKGWLALIAMAVPVVAATVVGMAGKNQPHLAALTLSLSILVYCIGEEWGWRGWLFEELAGLRLWQSALVTGILWYSWHWSFLPEARNLQFAIGIIAASFGFAVVARRTRSVGFAASWHAAMKLMWSPLQIGVMGTSLLVLTWAGKPREDRIGA